MHRDKERNLSGDLTEPGSNCFIQQWRTSGTIISVESRSTSRTRWTQLARSSTSTPRACWQWYSKTGARQRRPPAAAQARLVASFKTPNLPNFHYFFAWGKLQKLTKDHIIKRLYNKEIQFLSVPFCIGHPPSLSADSRNGWNFFWWLVTTWNHEKN